MSVSPSRTRWAVKIKGQTAIPAFADLFAKIQAALQKEKIFIEVVGGSAEDVNAAAPPP